ncbi:MAG: DUF4292 domain-containing protein [Pricia sp.]
MKTHLRSFPRYLGILLIILTVFSCKSKKAITDGGLDTNLSAKAIIRSHYQNAIAFKTLSGKMRIDYSDGEDAQGVSVSLRMEKDKAIWISAPFGVVKAYITPGRVTFYNKLQNEYFDGDFAYLSKYVGVELDFQQMQNLLVGQALLDLTEAKYDASVTGENYQLKPKKALELFKVLFQVNPKNFRMASQQLSQPLKKRLLQINYSDYEQTGKYLLPQKIAVAAIDNNERSTIDIEYRNIEFDRPLNFPYEIPDGYDEIKLKDDAL